MTGFLRLPMPSMRTSTRSPGSERARRRQGVPVAMTSPGRSVMTAETRGDDVLDREDEVLGVRGLAPLAVDPGLEVDAVGIDVGRDARPHRAEAVEGLGARRLAVAHAGGPAR